MVARRHFGEGKFPREPLRSYMPAAEHMALKNLAYYLVMNLHLPALYVTLRVF